MRLATVSELLHSSNVHPCIHLFIILICCCYFCSEVIIMYNLLEDFTFISRAVGSFLEFTHDGTEVVSLNSCLSLHIKEASIISKFLYRPYTIMLLLFCNLNALLAHKLVCRESNNDHLLRLLICYAFYAKYRKYKKNEILRTALMSYEKRSRFLLR